MNFLKISTDNDRELLSLFVQLSKDNKELWNVNEIKELFVVREKALANYGLFEFSTSSLAYMVSELTKSPYFDENSKAYIVTEMIDIYYYARREFDYVMTDNEIIDDLVGHYNGKACGSLDSIKDYITKKIRSNRRE